MLRLCCVDRHVYRKDIGGNEKSLIKEKKIKKHKCMATIKK